jgi:alanyl aminopeptidase
MRWSLFGLVLVACGSSTQPVTPTRPDPPPIAEPDLPPAPIPEPTWDAPKDPVRLGATMKVLAYAPRLTIDPRKSTFEGRMVIQAELPAATSEITLHGEKLVIHLARVRPVAGGEEIQLTPTDTGTGRIKLASTEPIPAGPVLISITYQGHIDDTDTQGVFRQETGGDWYVFTQFETISARRAFPCIDEPDVKVPWTVTLEVPAGMTAVGNAPVASEKRTADGTTFALAETTPLPSYLIAFGVGPFEIADAGKTKSGKPLRIFAFKGRKAETAIAAEITPKIVDWLEGWFGMSLPFAKLDALPIPITNTFGAMENAGLITYRADLVLLPNDAPISRKRRYAGIAAHEVAHQWFGDYVTPVWWDDIWLNESFATWLPVHLFGAVFPELLSPGHWASTRDRALRLDSLSTARRVRQPIATEHDIVGVFDGLTYQKGAVVLHMFEEWAGQEKFQQGVRDYLASHAHGNATAQDFLAAVTTATGVDITTPMSTFLDQAGVPRVDVAMTCTDGKASFAVSQSRYFPIGTTSSDPTPVWQIPVCIAYGEVSQRRETCALVAQPTQTIAGEACTADTWFFANAGGRGYYYTAIADDLPVIVKHGWKHLTADERVAVGQDVMAAVAAGEADVAVALDLVPLLVADGSPNLVDVATDIVNGVRRFVPPKDAAVAKWVRKQFGPLAKKLGWKPRKNDTYADLELREQVVPLVADLGADPALGKQAVALAKTWRKLPAGGARGEILWIAARTKPALVDTWRADFVKATDRVTHTDLAVALGRVGDRAKLEASLALILDPAIDVREAYLILGEALSDRVTQPWAEDWAVAHLDEIIARFPSEARSRLVATLTGSCDADKLEPMRAVADAKIVPVRGGPRAVAQAFEGFAQCVARRHALEPSLEAWRKTLK